MLTTPSTLNIILDIRNHPRNIYYYLKALFHKANSFDEYFQKDELLREHLSTAIANCCTWKKNCYRFGRLNAVKPLVSYMTSKNINVQRATALALHKLSSDPYNCVTLHRNGVVKVSVKCKPTLFPGYFRKKSWHHLSFLLL